MSELLDSAARARLEATYGPARVAQHVAQLTRNAAAIDDHALWLESAVRGEFEDMTIERVSRCACGSDSIEPLSRFVYWNLLGIGQCRDCGLVFTTPRLTEESLGRVFAGHYFDAAPPHHWDRRREPVFRDVYRLLREVQATRVLDVGTAYGHFLRWLGDRGIAAVGTDISAAAARWGADQLGATIQVGRLDTLCLPPGSFDCVVSLDALYYAHDPRAELDLMRRVLVPEGHLILRLRDNAGVARRARREGQRAAVGRPIYPPEHLWAFTPGSIASLLRRAGFRVVRMEPAAYSATLAHALQVAWVRIARLVRRMPESVALTRSFNVLARATS